MCAAILLPVHVPIRKGHYFPHRRTVIDWSDLYYSAAAVNMRKSTGLTHTHAYMHKSNNVYTHAENTVKDIVIVYMTTSTIEVQISSERSNYAGCEVFRGPAGS